jgi:hypothetical protein
MKPLILTIALLASFTAQAEDYCTEVSSAASTVMLNRLNGVDERRQLNLANDVLDGEELSVVRELIKDAYQQPESRDKNRAANDFGMTWLIKCSRNESGA